MSPYREPARILGPGARPCSRHVWVCGLEQHPVTGRWGYHWECVRCGALPGRIRFALLELRERVAYLMRA